MSLTKEATPKSSSRQAVIHVMCLEFLVENPIYDVV